MSPDTQTRTHTETASGATARTRVTAVVPGPAVRGMLALTAAGRRVGRFAADAGEWLGQTITPAGWLLVAATVLGFTVGAVFGWVEWLVAGFASVALLALSLPFLFGGRAYHVDVHLEHERVIAGGDVGAEIRIRNHGRRTALPGRLDLPVGDGLIEVGVPLLRPDHSVVQPVTIPTPRRGIIAVGPATAVRTDPIGLLRREHAWRDVHELYVRPRTVPVPATSAGLVRDLEGRATRRLVDADMSFHAIREYVPGDSRRQIHWKSTAKVGQLMVRQFEETRRARIAVVLSAAIGDYTDDDEFELAVSAAASLGAQAVRDGRDIAVVTGARVPRVVTGRVHAIQSLPSTSPRDLLDAFCGVESMTHTTPLEEVARLAAEGTEALSIAFVVFGSSVPLARMRQVALAFPADTAVVAVVCDERAHPRARAVGSLTVLTIGLLDDLPALLIRGTQTGAASGATGGAAVDGGAA